MEHGDHAGVWEPHEPPSSRNVCMPLLEVRSVLPVVSPLALLAYGVGPVRSRRAGITWRWWRTVAWTVGTVWLSAVTGTLLQGYGVALFNAHTGQHMVLSMIVPPLLLGAPVTTAPRRLPRGQGVAGTPRALLLEALHSRVARLLSHPLFTVPVFIGASTAASTSPPCPTR